MRNAKQEFADVTKNKIVICAEIGAELLKTGYTSEQYNAFLNSIDFEYDAGYGSQELFGMIWYADGSWSDRGEYDGSEWWNIQERPIIPIKLLF